MVQNNRSKYGAPEPGTLNTAVYRGAGYEGEERFGGQIYGEDFRISINSNVAIDALAEQFEDRFPSIKIGRIPTMQVPDTILRFHVLQDDMDGIHLQANTCDVTLEVQSELPLCDVARVLCENTPVNKLSDDKAFTGQKLSDLVEAVSAAIDNIEMQYDKAKTKERQLRNQREYM